MDRISQWPSDAAGDGDTPPKSFTLSVSLARPGWLWSTSGRPDHGQFPTGLGSCSRYDHPLRLLTTSVISHLSVISHQSSAISHQPSAISAIGHQPSAISHQPSISSQQLHAHFDCFRHNESAATTAVSRIHRRLSERRLIFRTP